MGAAVLEVSGVGKSFGKKEVLKGVSFSLCEGEIFGLLGPNGSGKSTLTKIISGIVKKDSGSVKFYGKEIGGNRKEVSKILGVIPQEEMFYRKFTVLENIEFFSCIYNINGKEKKETIANLLQWFSLENFKNTKAEFLSGGYRRMLNAACSLVHNPKIIFMDEPTVGLDPNMRELFWEKIKKLKQMGKTVCLTTHYMDEAQELCGRISLIVKGRIITEGTPEELIRKYGGETVLVLSLAGAPNKQALALMEKRLPKGVMRLENNLLFIRLSQEDVLNKIAKITEMLADSGIAVGNAIVKEPRLEDVFIKLQEIKDEKSH
ncbi:MAG: ABC transporter ATP-binding protein [Candidatus Diapherotrites archaeon]